MNPYFSIVVAYRNRESTCVSRFMESLRQQTFQDFELIFVDSGSDEAISNTIQSVCNAYAFCKYIFSDTRDMIWSKSLALNIGIVEARGRYFLGTDVDLIYSNHALQHLHSICNSESQIFCRAFKLPESFTEYDQLNALPVNFQLFNFTAYGLLHCFDMKWFAQVKGFDEYYKLWGFEDRDMAERLEALGLKSVWISETQYPIYHQWHHSGRIQLFMEWYWGDMCLHYANSKLLGNVIFTGKRIVPDHRPLNQLHPRIAFSTPRYINKFIYRDLVAELMRAILTQRDTEVVVEVLKISPTFTSRQQEKRTKSFLRDSLRSLFHRKPRQKSNAQADCDICYFFYELIFKSELLCDHRCTEDEDKISFTLLARSNVTTEPVGII